MSNPVTPSASTSPTSTPTTSTSVPAKKPFRPFTGLIGAIENGVVTVLSGGSDVVKEMVDVVVGLIPAAEKPVVELAVKEAEVVLADADAALAPVVVAPVVAPVAPAAK